MTDEKLRELYSLFGEAWFVYEKAVELKKSSNTLKRIGEMPIQYFGNIDKYWRSEPKVVTVGKNPSSNEYGRFEGVVNNIYESSLLGLYKYKLDNYFENIPYCKWFGHWCELLRGIDAKYGTECCNNNADNYALHTDFFSPIATDPFWNSLGECQKGLMKYGIPLWFKLIKFLEPDIIIMSWEKENNKKQKMHPFTNNFNDWDDKENDDKENNDNNKTIKNISSFSIVPKSNIKCSNTNIELFCANISDNKKTLLVWIEGEGGKPLSKINSKKEVGKCIKEIWKNINKVCP